MSTSAHRPKPVTTNEHTLTLSEINAKLRANAAAMSNSVPSTTMTDELRAKIRAMRNQKGDQK